ncbi:hypothetical protein C8A05DRAFT_35052 [Staphylotrichum tortipilum]|uniref:Uncharacterized protein n=1 Tax=Staphylotrichum tortipilum TaxID=2831512 RepID=A0AAN6MJF2_9PEZI|nr:hypothetical protein C8A05DRAFT_35052 [Staphylotrichum longicolle]
MSLMAHLPYIRFTGDFSTDADIVPQCSFEDWRRVIRHISAALDAEGIRDRARNIRLIAESPEFTKFAPAHIFGLAHTIFVDGGIILLDTKLGLIHWGSSSCPNIVEVNGRGWTKADVD